MSTKLKELATQIADTYESKNDEYGNSFGETFAQAGIITAWTRISDKMNRFTCLALRAVKPKHESLEDTLLDLATYCLMTVVELRKQNDDKRELLLSHINRKLIDGLAEKQK